MSESRCDTPSNCYSSYCTIAPGCSGDASALACAKALSFWAVHNITLQFVWYLSPTVVIKWSLNQYAKERSMLSEEKSMLTVKNSDISGIRAFTLCSIILRNYWKCNY